MKSENSEDIYELFLGEYPKDHSFNRVHVILLTPDGRVLLRYKNGEPRVTGGRIDATDVDFEAALRREVREEINCEIDKCDYLGYIKFTTSTESGPTVEYFARMVARVSKIGTPSPDPDREDNWIYGRTLAPLENAKQELGSVSKFGQNNLKLLDAAYKVAQAQGYFTEKLSTELEILNLESRD